MKKYIYILTLFATCLIAACSELEYDSVPPVAKVSNLTYTIDKRDVTLSWTLPVTDLSISGITVQFNNEAKMELPADATTYLYERVPLNRELAYTVKVKYENGRVSEGETVRPTIEGEVTSKFGFLIAYNDVSEIEDDDEKAAAEWFVEKYPTGEVITPEMATTIDLF